MKIYEECKGAHTIAIGGHVRPDGDCVGACLAMKMYLQKRMPEAKITVYLEKPSEIFSLLQGFDEIDSTFAKPAEPVDVFLCLDCDKSRLGDAESIFDEAKKTVNIDHHVSNARGTGMVNYVVPTASSASELVFDVLEEEYLDEEIAKALYVGIIHDTGVFHYSNTSPKTMQIGAKLISFGFDFTRIIGETFYEKTYHQNQILGRALLESILFMNGQCIVSSIDKKTMDFYEVTSKDMDGIASQLRQTKDVECAIFMYEIEPLVYKVSLRSGGKVDVSKVAEYFGGGGHVRAAGCTLNGTNHDVINNLSVHIEKQLLEAER